MAKYEWDIKPVVYMTEQKKTRAFKQVGAYIRADARQSIRVSVRNSKPGEPPKAKRRTFKNSIVFAADSESVVTGPRRQHPADSTPRILEDSGWRQDTLGRIRYRWAKANPEKMRELRKQAKAQARANRKDKSATPEPTKRVRSPRELDAIRRYYMERHIYTGLTRQEEKRLVRFHIDRRPYVQPAFEKNKQKALMLLGR